MRPQPQAVFAIFDPTGTPPRIPLPNDLTMIPATPMTPATSSFSGPIDPATITAMSVVVLDATAMAPILGATPSFDTATNTLTIHPPATGWPAGHRVAIALRGSPGGLIGTGGIPVVASPTFFFARGPNPISNCTAPGPNCTSATPALTVDQAIALERLRQALAPLVSALETLVGIPRTELVQAWTFTVAGAAPDGGTAGDAGTPTDGGGAGMDGSAAMDGGASTDGAL